MTSVNEGSAKSIPTLTKLGVVLVILGGFLTILLIFAPQVIIPPTPTWGAYKYPPEHSLLQFILVFPPGIIAIGATLMLTGYWWGIGESQSVKENDECCPTCGRRLP